MGLPIRKTLGIDVIIASKQQVLEETGKYLEKVKSQKSKVKSDKAKTFVIFTPNPEIIVYAQKDYVFKRIVNSAQINIPDGAGVSWAIKKLYGLSVERVSGADLMLDLCNLSSRKGLRIGLIGGRGGLAVKALECLQKEFPRLKGYAIDGPEIEITNNKLQISEDDCFVSLADKIMKNKIDVLFVGLGFPKQEYFIENVKCQMSNVKLEKPMVMMAVGGSFDYISGKIPRAPKFMRERGLEWLYRLIREPWRLGRQIKGAEFFYRILTS